MDISFTVDLPPVPECFSKLLVSGSETAALPSQPWREAERLRELRDIMLKSLAVKSVPEASVTINRDVKVTEASVSDQSITSKDNGSVDSVEYDYERARNTQSVQHFKQPGDKSSPPFCRLNSALERLKREMVDLRHLDMSLFCQLLTLNEAIQDFKMSVGDRCSEYTGSEYTSSEYAGSEYSFGGMGSRTGSFSSLNDDTDWGGDFRMLQEDPNSPVSPGDGAEDGECTADDLAASTSSLLQQIKALTQRAERDF